MDVKNYDELLKQSKEIIDLEESQVDFICQKDYYEAK